jgi:hypothetical protein
MASKNFKFVFLKTNFLNEKNKFFQKFQCMRHYILPMTGFGIKMQKSEFHCCIMVTTAFGRFSVYYTKFCVTD